MTKMNGSRTGECFIKEGLIKKKDIEKVLLLQEKGRTPFGAGRGKLFGTLLCDLSLTDPVSNYYFLHKYGKVFQPDHFLSFHHILPPEMVKMADTKSKESDTPILSALLNLGMIKKIQLINLVQELYNLPFMFIRPHAFKDAETQDLPFAFNREDARKKRMLPLVIKNKTVLIGITDPANLLSVYDLAKKYPALKFNPAFILHSCFHRFFHLLYEQDSKGPEPDLALLLNSKVTLSDPGTDAASIAALYTRYELLNGVNGNSKTEQRIGCFKKFMFQTHQKITRHHGCRSVDYLFKQQKNQVNLIAIPKN